MSAALLLALAGGLAAAPLPARGQVGPRQQPLRTHSRAAYVHRLTLYDHHGAVIDPQDPQAGPYSPRATCAKCHDYAVISHGWHFNEPDPQAAPGRAGEPWFLLDPASGTQLPVSYRKWPGTFTPQELGLSAWDMVKRFGRHIPGGGFGAPSDEQVKASREALRWGISGKLEIDCMFCHAADQQHDPAEAARQIERENFKWAATAALGLAVVRGDAAKAPADWDPLLPPDPDHPERAGPQLVWDETRFDPDDRVLFNITRRVPNQRCYFCHSLRQVGSDAEHELVLSQDVHLAAGLLCVDCHRNGIAHRIIRGYATPTAEETKRFLESSSYESVLAEVARDAYSCRGCHLGTEAWGGGSPPIGNRYGAPYPQHAGLPPLHLEKLTCTACHCGPWPRPYARRFQSARAHGLGLATRDRADDDLPHIVGPVFARQHDGKIAPQRMVWPAFWGRLAGARVAPLDLRRVRQAVRRVAPERFDRQGAPPGPLELKQIAAVLALLAAASESQHPPVYVRDGRLYRYWPEGRLSIQPPGDGPPDPRAAPYRWSLAHEVRPAGQALGVRGCTDCHAADAPLYFGRISAIDAAAVPGPPIRTMRQLRGEGATLARAWAVGFRLRPALRWFGWVCAALLLLVLLYYLLRAVGAVLRRFG